MNLPFEVVEVPGLCIINGLHSSTYLAHLHLLGCEGWVLSKCKDRLFFLGQSINFLGEFFTLLNFTYRSKMLNFLEGPFDLVVNLIQFILMVGSDFISGARNGVLDLSLRPLDLTVHNSYLLRKDR